MQQIVFESFGYSNGQPRDTACNFNLRKLPNPAKEIKSKHTGLYKSLQEDLFSIPAVQAKFTQLCEEIITWLNSDSDSEQSNEIETEMQHKLGFGCFSGKHRSVAMVERLVIWASEQSQFKDKYEFVAHHRDINITGSQKSLKKSKRIRRDKTQYSQ